MNYIATLNRRGSILGGRERVSNIRRDTGTKQILSFSYLPVSICISKTPSRNFAKNFRWTNDSGLLRYDLGMNKTGHSQGLHWEVPKVIFEN